MLMLVKLSSISIEKIAFNKFRNILAKFINNPSIIYFIISAPSSFEAFNDDASSTSYLQVLR